jgi:NAD-dependent SIR2 family protein deacetylase
MADIIQFDADRRQKKYLLLEAIGRLMQCAGCHAKCTRCGMTIDIDDEPLPLFECEAVLCPSCGAEYEAYQERLAGKNDPEIYWLNESWMKAWASWLEYQKAVTSFKHSKEFIRLVNDPPRF